MTPTVATTVDLDLSLPIATLLRVGTAAAHERAEHSEGAGWLTRGELDKEEYVRFLMMLWHIYDHLECALEQYASHSTLYPTHNPALFARSSNIAADISHLLQVNESTWQSHPMHTALMLSPPSALTDYVSRIEAVAESSDPSPLLSHAYVRYLGDLSGGQFIRRRVVKAYGLENGNGVQFYDFKPLGGTGSGTIGDMKKIKEWYRDGMNTAVGNDKALKAAIVREANLAFELSTAIFASLKAPSSTPPFYESTSPIDSESEPTTPIEEDTKSEAVSKVVYEAAEPKEWLYRLSSIISVVAALSLAHFILVVGGFTGERGYAKLEAFQQWFTSAAN
ncbi:Heme oxygenase 2 [Grifola frondosa]|uniref:Heme oxygenase 2 n=1 Tax=Grifola frondosa TaxID=5627 RepID=A0A1C7M566_GRIFR|nr:Heme oxygenase 2 [Grifola frondosa]